MAWWESTPTARVCAGGAPPLAVKGRGWTDPRHLSVTRLAQRWPDLAHFAPALLRHRQDRPSLYMVTSRGSQCGLGARRARSPPLPPQPANTLGSAVEGRGPFGQVSIAGPKPAGWLLGSLLPVCGAGPRPVRRCSSARRNRAAPLRIGPRRAHDGPAQQTGQALRRWGHKACSQAAQTRLVAAAAARTLAMLRGRGPAATRGSCPLAWPRQAVVTMTTIL